MRGSPGLFVLLALMAVPPPAAGFLLQSRQLLIVADKPLDVAPSLLEGFPQLAAEVERNLGLQLQARPTLLLVQDKAQFELMSGSPFVAGFAVPSKNLMVLQVSPSEANLLRLPDLLRHELCHLVLHENIEPSVLPRWLDEGVCQWVSGTFGEFLAEGRPDLGRGDFPRNYIPLSELADGFPAGQAPLELAYWESRSFVQFLSARYGRGSVMAILGHLQSGSDVDGAFLAVAGKSATALEAQWLRRESGRSALLIWIGQYLYETLFFAAALLAIFASIRLVIRRRKVRLGEDESGHD